MKKFLVIGNPIEHTLSPKLHNYWIKKNNINAIYEKKKLENNDLENLILQVRTKKIYGINVACIDDIDVFKFKDVVVNDGRNHPLDKK